MDSAKKEPKTPEYTRRAIEKYRSTKEQITISFPLGTREKIRSKCGGVSINQYINDLVLKDLNRE